MSSTGEHFTPIDPEKATEVKAAEEIPASTSKNPPAQHDATLDFGEAIPSDSKFIILSRRIEHLLGLEARGIHRVKANEQTHNTTLSFMQVVVLWLSINTAAMNITLASIGQTVYELGFWDATLCSVLGAILGSIPAAYTAGWGPWSGNRTMVSGILVYNPHTFVDFRIDMCSIFDGMVANEALCSAEFGGHAWICDD
jgi:hypothetical protein